MDNIVKYFSKSISNEIINYFNFNQQTSFQEVEEIRIRNNKPIILKLNNSEIVFNYVVNTEDMLESLEKICENSIYTYQNQICNGFITVKGGHRVGVTGNAVMESEKIININYISGLNFRIARQLKGCSKKILDYVVNYQENTVFNTLIVSSPGGGKTTILRDLVLNISSGFNCFQGLNVGVVDERGELAAMYKGVPQNDWGLRTDVLDNVTKAIGMKLLIRSMAPQVIVADEIGGTDDVEIINYAVCSGIKGIFTAHGADLEDLYLNPTIKRLLEINVLERIIFLGNKQVQSVYGLNKKTLKYEKFILF